MSSIPIGGANIFMGAKASGNFFLHNSGVGWPGNAIVEAQPLNTGASLVCVPGKIDLLSDGTFKFFTKITNNGPNSTFFNMQFSFV
jgi:hypothetical protein